MSCTRIEWISVKSAYQGQWTWTVDEKGVQQTCSHYSWPRQMELLQIYRGVHSRSAVIAVITATSGGLLRNNVTREWCSSGVSTASEKVLITLFSYENRTCKLLQRVFEFQSIPVVDYVMTHKTCNSSTVLWHFWFTISSSVA